MTHIQTDIVFTKIFRLALLCAGIILNLNGTNYVQAQQLPAPTQISNRVVLDRFCISCHNEVLNTANLSFQHVDVESPGSNPELWEKVVRKLHTRAMPPPGMPRPTESQYESLINQLESALDSTAFSNPDPGRLATFHRLNRVEYINAVRDLLAVQFDGESMLPDDNAEHGFDNIGDALSTSPLLMESYMRVAKKVSALALGIDSIGTGSEIYEIDDGFIQDERMSEDLPFGSRGGLAVRHNFPLDGEYEITIKLARNTDGFIRGMLDQRHTLVVRVGGKLVKQFLVGGEMKGRTGPIHSRLGGGTIYRFDPEQMAYENYGDSGLQVRFPAKAGNHLVQVYFLKRNFIREGLHEYFKARTMTADLRDFKAGEPVINHFSVVGPYNATGPGDTPSRYKILQCYPKGGVEDVPCAKTILSTLARQAYRRPVKQEDIVPLLELYSAGREEGNFEDGIARAIRGILVSPEFLFRVERDPVNVAPSSMYTISELDLATRLSFFLWSSIPDDELLDLAEQGKLRDPEIMKPQVRRMLADSRSKSLITNFAAQWLNLRNLRLHFPDNRLFPDFDGELRIALQKETELFLESMIFEDRPVMELINADYTYLNQRLADHYGFKDIYGSHFRKVYLKDVKRRGLLGLGSILTLTSRPNRTSPVIRGKWVLENLLGTPPPPPPPDVPALNEKPSTDKSLTMRERMEQHRNNLACASCHAQMDAFGFALDNFDPVGIWRLADNGIPINVEVALPDGTEFEGPEGVRNILQKNKEVMLHNFTEKLFIYALGRGIRPQDQPFIRKILQESSAENYNWSSIIFAIIKSVPFQMRRAKSL